MAVPCLELHLSIDPAPLAVTIIIIIIIMSLWDKAVESLEDEHKQNVDFQRTDKHAILADVLEEVRKKKEACIERRLKYKRRNGEFVVLYDVYEKMVKWVNKFKEVGDIAMQYDPGHAALPWAGIRFLLQISVNDVQMFGSLVEGLEVVCKIIARYAAVERLYLRQSATVENLLEDSIIELYASILVFFSKCRKNLDLGLGHRLARSIIQVPEQSINKYLDKIVGSDEKVSNWTGIIDAERAQLSAARQSSMTDKIDILGNEVEKLQTETRESASRLKTLLASFQSPIVRTVDQIWTLTENLVRSQTESQVKEERLKILLWLSTVEYKKHHQSISKCLLEGTGSWLLEKPQFIEWRNSSVSSVLWLHGIPGSGKTCLMSTVIHQLLTENSTFENAAPIAYFYCQRNTAEPQRSDPTEVFRAILRQLLCYNPRWQEESSTANEYRARKKEADKEGFDVSGLDISETTDQIIEIASNMPVTILIDALDECRPDRRHELLRVLDDLLEKSAHLVKIFVSSRDDINIVLKLEKHPNIYITIDDNKSDVQRFIGCKIQQAQNDRRMLKGTVSPELTTLITEKMATKAGGMFLWASLQIENLCDSRRIKVEGDLVDELARLPRSLADMYASILKDIGEIEQHGRTIAETVMKWLLCTEDATRRVTIAACSGHLTDEHRDLSVSDILDVCSTLVVFDEPLDSFRFAHLSVQEFLESQPGYTPSEANRSVLERSLQKVIHDRPSPKTLQYSRYPERTDPGDRVFDDHIWNYASSNWISHYGNLEEQYRKEFFEHHAKKLFFDGTEPIYIFDTWTRMPYKMLGFYFPFGRSYEEVSLRSIEGRWISVDRDPSSIDLASVYGFLEILDYFEANQTHDDFHGPAMRLMSIAICSGQISVVRWLIDRKFYPTYEHLKMAFCVGRLDVVHTLVETYALSLNTLINGQNLLASNFRFNIGDMYQDLIRKRAGENHRDQNGPTLTSYAELDFSSCDSNIIEDLLLLERYPRINSLSHLIWGNALHLISSLLTDQYINSQYPPGNQTYSDVMRCVIWSYHAQIACLLVHFTANSVLEDADIRAEVAEILQLVATFPGLQSERPASLTGQTLLGLASLFRHDKAFRILLDMGIDPACPAIGEIRKRISIITHMNHSMSVQEPLDQRSERNHGSVSDELRQGPLAWAAYTGNLPLVQSILDRGLDPNIKNRKGQTALYFAVQETEDKNPRIDLETDKEAIVKLLLQKGALVTSADAYGGASILANAFKARNNRVARIILQSGVEKTKGATGGPTEHIRGAFNQGEGGIRQALFKKVGGAQSNLLNTQLSSLDYRCSGDVLDLAARLIKGGTMRVLGDMISNNNNTT